MTVSRIVIEFIPQADMRVPGWGDWYYEGDILQIRSVSDDPECDPFLVAFHELAEAWLCKERGVTEAEVDAFDLAFIPPADDPEAEPGDHPDAPYRYQHRQAMMIEHLMALFLGADHYGEVR